MAAPNIVVILTDDQDNTGSMAHMPKVLIESRDDKSTRAARYTEVRTATKKYVRHKDGSEELFDLAADPYELQDQAGDASYAGDLATLRSIEQGLKSCAGETCWMP